jgi:hypothetical protein
MVPAPPRTAPRRWGLAAALAVAGLLQAVTWAGLGMGAFVLWDAVHAFYFQQSWRGEWLPLAVAGALAVTALLLVLRQAPFARIPAFAAMLSAVALVPRMGQMSPLAGFIHPMQLVAWGALALTFLACLWVLAGIRPATASERSGV